MAKDTREADEATLVEFYKRTVAGFPSWPLALLNEGEAQAAALRLLEGKDSHEFERADGVKFIIRKDQDGVVILKPA